MPSPIVGSICRIDQLTGAEVTLDVAVADHELITRAAIAWHPGAMFNWRAVANYWPERSVLAATLKGGVPLAFVQFDDDYRPLRSPEATNQTVYVSFLEVAPLVRSSTWYSFVGLGAAMLSFAVARSRQLGYEGRVGLHTISHAREFYAKLGFHEAGLVPGPNEYWETYLELLPGASDRFLAPPERS